MGKKNRQQSGSSPKVPLLDSEEWLSAQLLRALQTVFQRFDADGDGALNEAELQAFARACNGGTELDADELDQIQDYFDTDDSGALTLRGFHEMYHMQTRSRSAAATAPALTAPALRPQCTDRKRARLQAQRHLEGHARPRLQQPARSRRRSSTRRRRRRSGSKGGGCAARGPRRRRGRRPDAIGRGPGGRRLRRRSRQA